MAKIYHDSESAHIEPFGFRGCIKSHNSVHPPDNNDDKFAVKQHWQLNDIL